MRRFESTSAVEKCFQSTLSLVLVAGILFVGIAGCTLTTSSSDSHEVPQRALGPAELVTASVAERTGQGTQGADTNSATQNVELGSANPPSSLGLEPNLPDDSGNNAAFISQDIQWDVGP